jgi:hypothetical protein
MTHPVPHSIFDSAQLSGLIDLLGSPAWPARLLSSLASTLHCAHLSAFVFDAQLNPHQVMAQSLTPEPVAERAGPMVRPERVPHV